MRRGAVLDHRVAGVLHVIVGTEAEAVVLALAGGIDPATLVTAEGALLVVAGHDALPQLRADGLQSVAGAGDDGEVATQGVLGLGKVLCG